jgi:sulfur-oxidizing protein SoxA
MRCPRFSPGTALALGAALAACALSVAAAPDAVRSEVAQRLQRQLPGTAPADYALGSAAFDTDLRAAIESNAAAGTAVAQAGARLWARKFKDGRSLASCFPNGGRRIAATYPQFDLRLKRVMTLEMAINQCLRSHKEPLYDPADPATMGAVTAHLRSLANGVKLAVRVPAAAEESFEQGRRLYFSRLGQRNYACASCHVQGAGKRYVETPLSPAIGQATHWPLIHAGQAVSLQASIRECLERMGAAPFAPGSEELNNVEYFLTYLSNGLPLKANPWRPD